MTNLYPQNRGRSLPLMTLVVLTAVLTAFGVDYVSDGALRSMVRNTSAVALSSAALTQDTFADFSFFTTRKALQDESERLRAELALTTELAGRIVTIVDENIALREMARLASSESVGITVPVLSAYHESIYGTFIIGSGRDQGVERGSVVLTPGGYALGHVSALDDSTATVHGAFAPDSTLALMVRDIAFEAEGRGAGNARAEVPREAQVQVGDVVLAQKYGSRPVGIIEKIDSESSNTVLILYIRVPTNLETLRFAYVIPLP